MTDIFTDEQIARLRESCSHLNTIDPCQPTYPKLIALLDQMTQEQLRQIAKAQIKFLSALARNRVIKADVMRMVAP